MPILSADVYLIAPLTMPKVDISGLLTQGGAFCLRRSCY